MTSPKQQPPLENIPANSASPILSPQSSVGTATGFMDSPTRQSDIHGKTDAATQLKGYGATYSPVLSPVNANDDIVPEMSEKRSFNWRRLMDPEFYPEVTIRRSVFFFIWTIPHIIICAYRGSNKKRNLANQMNQTSMACILFDLGAILVFMSPTFLSLLRRTFLPRFITFEKNIHAHKVASYTMLFWSAIHIGYYYNQYIGQTKPGMKRGRPSNGTPLVENLFKIKTGWTGHVLMFALFLIVVTAISMYKPIRKRLFEVFYYAHHLFIVYIAVMFIHHRAYMTRKYVSGPLALYCVDRIYRNLRSAFAKSPVRAVIQHPSGLVEIQLDKRILGHRPGQFVKVYCPSVSLLQWHPMTISSAPEEELLTIHFRIYGGWTKRLAARLGFQFDGSIDNIRRSTTQVLITSTIGSDAVTFGRHRQAVANADSKPTVPLSIPYHPLHHDPSTAPMYSQAGAKSSYISLDIVAKGSSIKKGNPVIASTNASEVSSSQLENGGFPLKLGPTLPVIFIDGPYSSPTEHFFEYEVGVLIAAGIGVTPAASVLRSTYFKRLQNPDRLHTKKVYLFWVYREIKTLEWFKDLLIALNEEGLGSIVEVRTYYTGKLDGMCMPEPAADGDMFGDKVIQSVIGTTSYVGRPDFGDIFDAVGASHPNTCIGTFFCGPKPMLRKTRREAHKWDSVLRKRSGTKLDFHSEVFF
ncbi:hypothetical protein LPJ53_004253 [Coemansia erecta]|uniref:FAD-binding FR-type domain-containing protein n=1 Tax=Coemansia erecta TaxID=147472 RepID=A0A9W7Y077_9FUNG|nr:hypothetical protein LPJ53_004253 [Coemansia erecta]